MKTMRPLLYLLLFCCCAPALSAQTLTTNPCCFTTRYDGCDVAIYDNFNIQGNGNTQTQGIQLGGIAVFNGPSTNFILSTSRFDNRGLVIVQPDLYPPATGNEIDNRGIILYDDAVSPACSNVVPLTMEVSTATGYSGSFSVNNVTIEAGVYSDAAGTDSIGVFDMAAQTITITDPTLNGQVEVYLKTTIFHDYNDGRFQFTYCDNVTRYVPFNLTLAADPPTVSCQAATLYLDGGGNATLQAADVVANASAGCSGTITATTLSQTAFNCGNLGSGNTVTVTVTDSNGGTVTCNATVTVLDTLPPPITSAPGFFDGQRGLFELRQQGILIGPNDCLEDIVIPAFTNTNDLADLNAKSQFAFDLGTIFSPRVGVQRGDDNCTGFFDTSNTNVVSKDPTSTADTTRFFFDYTITDNQGNGATYRITATLVNDVAPQIDCPQAAVTLSTSPGSCTGTGAADLTTINTCSPATFSYDLSGGVTSTGLTTLAGVVFPAGITTVTATATGDVNMLTSAPCVYDIVVTDNEAPTITCNPLTVQLDAMGLGMLDVSQISGNAADNCGVQSVTASQTSFGCGELGVNNVTVTVTDVNGNTATCNAVVTVEDNNPNPPVATGLLTWTGQISSDWNTPCNWQPYGVPGPQTQVSIPSNSPNAPALQAGTTYAAQALTLQSGVQLTLPTGSSFTVGGTLLIDNATLTNEGTLDPGAVTLQNGGALTNRGRVE